MSITTHITLDCGGPDCFNSFGQPQVAKPADLRRAAKEHGWQRRRVPFYPWQVDLCQSCDTEPDIYERLRAAGDEALQALNAKLRSKA